MERRRARTSTRGAQTAFGWRAIVACALYPANYGPHNQGIQSEIDKAIQGGIYVINGTSVDYEGVLGLLGLSLTPHRARYPASQDLARAAEVHDLVTRAISGHATETMQGHDSTVSDEGTKRNKASSR